MKTTAEQEIKLEAAEGFRLPQLGGTPLPSRVFTSVYYDVPGNSLARAGITLRRRTEHGGSVWQLKLPRDGFRLELEEPGGPAGPPAAIGRLLGAHLRAGALAPIASLRTRRRGELVARKGATAEVTVDEVAVMDALRVVSAFVEVEVELRSGDLRRLSAVVDELEGAGARPSDGTPKVFRALGLDGAKPKRPSEPFESLRALLSAQLEQLYAHDPGTRLGADPEDLHDVRVAVRRLRALLRAGRAMVATPTDELREELKWLGGELGHVRDLDVLLERLHAEAAELDDADRAAADVLLRGLERERKAARRTMLRVLDGARYFALLDRMGATIAALEPSGAPTKLSTLARRELRKLQRDVTAAGDDPRDETLHELRKRGKRARYAHELAGKSKAVRRAKAFQDVLGEHQDAVVAEERLRALAATAEPAQALAAGRLLERERARRIAARARWRDVWRPLSKSA